MRAEVGEGDGAVHQIRDGRGLGGKPGVGFSLGELAGGDGLMEGGLRVGDERVDARLGVDVLAWA
jgi:hypothetical protein